MAKRVQPRPNSVLLLEERLKRKKAETYPKATSDQFFLLSSIDTILRSRNLSYQEIDHGITEGQDDGGIDAVFTFLNGKLVDDEHVATPGDGQRIELEIVQVKNESGFNETAIQKLIDHLPLLVRPEPDPGLDIEFNGLLLERLGIFRKLYNSINFASTLIRVWYITRAVEPAHLKVKRKTNRLRTVVKNEIAGAEVVINLVGAQELNTEARRRSTPILKLQATERPVSAEKGGLVCLVSLRDWYEFISGEDGAILESIFEENVRGFVGNTRINRSIMQSLSEGDGSSADFWWLNNGVTVLGRRVESRHRSLTIEDPQVVNGLQTSRSVYQYFQSSSDSSSASEGSGRHLLVRVIQADDEVLSSRIIQATNSQNRVDGASLRATEPLQREIEEYFSNVGFYYERRKNHYKNTGAPREQLIEVLEVAQAMAAILLCEPHVARGQPSALVREPRYGKIFDSKVPLPAYLNTTLIVRRIDDYLTEVHDALNRQGRGNIRFQLARAAAAFALMSARPKPSTLTHLEPDLFTDDRLSSVYEWTLARRRAAENSTGSDQNLLAKSAEWSRQIDEQLVYYTSKNRWPTEIPVAWGKG